MAQQLVQQPQAQSQSQSPPCPKVHLTIDAKGWTHVFKDGIKYRAYQEHHQKTTVPEGLTLAAITEKYEDIVVKFKESKVFTDLVEFFEHTLLKLENLRLDTCICMGLGTFTTAHTYCSPDPEPSLYQLAAFETMLEIIQRKHHIKNVYFQDPVMNSLDEALIASKGFTVLHHPEAMNRMSATTFLYGPSNEWSTTRDLFEVASPAVYIGNYLENYLKYIKRFENGREVDWHDPSNVQLLQTVFKPYADQRATQGLAVSPFPPIIEYRVYWNKD